MTFTGIATIKAPHFYAGVVVERDKIVNVPPNLKYMQQWTYPELKAFVIKHHWRIAEMSGAIFERAAVDQRDARQHMPTATERWNGVSIPSVPSEGAHVNCMSVFDEIRSSDERVRRRSTSSKMLRDIKDA
jgi:hypothetical protein